MPADSPNDLFPHGPVMEFVDLHAQYLSIRGGIDEAIATVIPELFQRVISTLDALSTDEMQQRRIRFALANTYSQQLRTIDLLSARLLR